MSNFVARIVMSESVRPEVYEMRQLSGKAWLVVSILSVYLLSPIGAQANNLSLGISGHIKTRCTIEFVNGVALEFSNKTLSYTISFDLFCNQPLRITLSTKYGGLRRSHSPDQFATPYSLGLVIPALDINTHFLSQELSTPRLIESPSVAPFSIRGKIMVTLERPLLYAGDYKDVVEIDVLPSINDFNR